MTHSPAYVKKACAEVEMEASKPPPPLAIKHCPLLVYSAVLAVYVCLQLIVAWSWAGRRPMHGGTKLCAARRQRGRVGRAGTIWAGPAPPHRPENRRQVRGYHPCVSRTAINAFPDWSLGVYVRLGRPPIQAAPAVPTRARPAVCFQQRQQPQPLRTEQPRWSP